MGHKFSRNQVLRFLHGDGLRDYLIKNLRRWCNVALPVLADGLDRLKNKRLQSPFCKMQNHQNSRVN